MLHRTAKFIRARAIVLDAGYLFLSPRSGLNRSRCSAYTQNLARREWLGGGREDEPRRPCMEPSSSAPSRSFRQLSCAAALSCAVPDAAGCCFGVAKLTYFLGDRPRERYLDRKLPTSRELDWRPVPLEKHESFFYAFHAGKGGTLGGICSAQPASGTRRLRSSSCISDLDVVRIISAHAPLERRGANLLHHKPGLGSFTYCEKGAPACVSCEG